jgi:1-deoxy-D-xylulose-5-phosphate reductoisomerase
MRRIALLGSTGSIGTSTLDVVAAHPERLQVVALAAGRNRELFRAQCERFRPACVSLARVEDAAWLAEELSYAPVVLHGMDGLMACALQAGADTVVAAVVGAAGLASVEAALRSGRRVCVANKESLVVGGALMRQALADGGGELLPVDSEHCALHQLLAGRALQDVREIRITASGGPFRDWELARIQAATVQEALNHPTWKMGPKITIDSATLMNKGLEVIEASVLFGLDADQIRVTVHPQSHGRVPGRHLPSSGVRQRHEAAHPVHPALSGPPAGTRATLRLGHGPDLEFRAPGPGAVPLPAPGLRRPAGGRHRPGHPQRRQRGGGGRLPGRGHRVLADPGLRRRSSGEHSRRTCPNFRRGHGY